MSEFGDARMRRLSKRLEKVYARAKEELTEKVDSFFKDFKRLDEKKQEFVLAGKLTEQEYKQWRKNKLLMGQKYKDLQETIADKMLDTNRIAAQYINGELPAIYAHNFNRVGGNVAKQVQGYSFDLVNETTIRNLSTANRTLLPYKFVDGHRDVRWNTKRVNSEILQGILQGESADQMSKRLMNVTVMNKESALRNARTAVTSAQNKGRVDAMKQCEDDGVIMGKEWIATKDERTRDAHLELDRVVVKVDEPFENEIGQIMYPGDPDADPANTYNCRCTIAEVVLGFKPKEEVQEEAAEEQTVESEQQSEVEEEAFNYGPAVEGVPDEYAHSIRANIDSAPEEIRDNWERMADDLQAPVYDANPKIGEAYFDPDDGKTHYVNEEKAYGQSSYQEENAVYFHENGHAIDYAMGDGDGYISSQFEEGAFPDTIVDEVEHNLKEFYVDKHPEWIDPDKADFFDLQKSYFKPEWYNDPQEAFEGQLRMYVLDIREEVGREKAREISGMLREASGDNERLKEIFNTQIAPTEHMKKYMKEELETFKSLRREPYREENIREFISSVKEHFTIYERTDISDMFDAYFSVNAGVEGAFGVGHGRDYFSTFQADGSSDIKRIISKKRLGTEAFAEMYSATMTQNQSLSVIKQFFPRSYEIFIRMLGGK